MAIGYREQSAGSVPLPPVGEQYTFIDSSDNILKRKDSTGAITIIETGATGPLVFQTTWNAATNSPALASSTGTKGHFYIVSVAGTTLLDGINDWGVGDWVVFDGFVWRKIDNSESAALPPTGPASGDLAGNYPGPVLAPFGTAGTYTKVIVDSKGRVSSGTTLSDTDIPSLPANKIPLATGSADGYLSQTDWNTFNSKQAAGNYITALTGEATASGPGSASTTLSNAAVIAKVLTGLASNNWNVVQAADSILQAIGKLSMLSVMTPNEVSSDTTVPSGYTWLRQNKTLISGTTKITIQSGGKLTILP